MFALCAVPIVPEAAYADTPKFTPPNPKPKDYREPQKYEPIDQKTNKPTPWDGHTWTVTICEGDKTPVEFVRRADQGALKVTGDVSSSNKEVATGKTVDRGEVAAISITAAKAGTADITFAVELRRAVAAKKYDENTETKLVVKVTVVKCPPPPPNKTVTGEPPKETPPKKEEPKKEELKKEGGTPPKTTERVPAETPKELRSELPQFPNPSLTPGVSYGTDRVKQCTFGTATPYNATLIPSDADGNPIPSSIPVSDTNNPTDANTPVLADKSDTSGIVIKDDDNWTWDPKENVYVSKKDPKVKRPVPTSVKPGQMWDPDGDPEGKSPIEPETSGNSRTYIDPKTGKIITRQFVDGEKHVYQRDDNFDQNRNPQLVRVYDPLTGKLQHRTTTDPKTGIVTKEDFDKDGTLTNIGTFKDNQQLTNETYENGKLVKRTHYWPGTDKLQKVEEDFDGDKPKKTTDYPLVTEPSTPPGKTATDTSVPSPGEGVPTADVQPPSQPVTVIAFEKTAFKGTTSGTAEAEGTVALFVAEPGLPGTGTKSAKGSGDGPTRCTFGAERHCQMDISVNDQQAFGLPQTGRTPTYYRLEVETPEHTGWVADTTGKTINTTELERMIPAGGKLLVEQFTEGGRTITRIGFNQPADGNVELTAILSKILGVKLELDRCERTKPASPFALQPAPHGLANQIPATVIRLQRAQAVGRMR